MFLYLLVFHLQEVLQYCTNGSFISAIQIDHFISTAAQSDLRRVFQGMQTVPGLNAVDQRGAVPIPLGVNQIHASLIQGHRVIGGQDANVVHIRLGGIAAAIAVHA